MTFIFKQLYFSYFVWKRPTHLCPIQSTCYNVAGRLRIRIQETILKLHSHFFNYSFGSMMSTCLSSILHPQNYAITYIWKTFKARFEPGSAGWDAETQPLCHSVAFRSMFATNKVKLYFQLIICHGWMKRVENVFFFHPGWNQKHIFFYFKITFQLKIPSSAVAK